MGKSDGMTKPEPDMRAKSIAETEFRPYTRKDVNRSSAKELFSVVSTFAGGGGSSTGYRLAGGDIKFVNEFVDEAVKSYRANYPNTPIDSSDIRTITKSAAKVQALCAKYGVKKGQLDILDGSPPCKDFSQSKGAVSVQSFTNELAILINWRLCTTKRNVCKSRKYYKYHFCC